MEGPPAASCCQRLKNSSFLFLLVTEDIPIVVQFFKGPRCAAFNRERPQLWRWAPLMNGGSFSLFLFHPGTRKYNNENKKRYTSQDGHGLSSSWCLAIVNLYGQSGAVKNAFVCPSVGPFTGQIERRMATQYRALQKKRRGGGIVNPTLINRLVWVIIRSFIIIYLFDFVCDAASYFQFKYQPKRR